MRSLSWTSGPLPAVALIVTWSSGFIGARLATDTANTLTVLMWRFLLVTALVVPWWLLVRRRQHRLTGRDVAIQALVGLLAQSIYLISSVKAIELGVPTGTTALIESLQPLFAGVLVGPLLKERVSGPQWAGLVLGLVGVAMVIGDGLSLASGRPGWVYAVPFVGMITLTAATLLQRKKARTVALTDSLTIQCCTSVVLFVILGVATGHARPPQDGDFWVAVVWTVALATFGGYGLYWLNLKHYTVTRVNSLIYLCPATTAFWAFLMFGEPIGPLAMAGFGVSLIAVLLVNRAEPPDTAAPDTPRTPDASVASTAAEDPPGSDWRSHRTAPSGERKPDQPRTVRRTVDNDAWPTGRSDAGQAP
ncbi:DMT family transporter [Streptomyces achromogenes]|uniref:DMT family transporter n=1 Tax=Streptomyces achromogenes TaxID=67255 RepID=UPI00369B2D57